MAYADFRSILDLGHFQLAAKQADKLSAAHNSIGRKIGEFADDGGGYLTLNMSKHLVAHLQDAIFNNGTTVPGYQFIEYNEKYWKWKIKTFGGNPGQYRATDTLMNSIKILNRRYGTGGATRGTVVGIDQTKKVKRIKGRGQVSVAAYAYAIEFGYKSGKPRMMLTYATQDWLNRYGPATSKKCYNKFLDDATKEMWKNSKNSPSKAKPEAQQIEANYVYAMTALGIAPGVQSRFHKVE